MKRSSAVTSATISSFETFIARPMPWRGMPANFDLSRNPAGGSQTSK